MAADSSDDILLIERDGDVALLTLNRPKSRNALNVALAGAICDAVAASQDARAIVVTGTDPAFCAGLDLRDLGVEDMREIPPFLDRVAESAVPLVAAVNGPAVTGGLELALGCDFIVASERAAFADTHLRVGVFPGPVVLELPRRVGGAWAREMSLTGNFVDADTALRIGLVNHVVPHEQLLPTALELARAIAEQDPAMVRAVRGVWNDTIGQTLADARRIHLEQAAAGGVGTTTGSGIAARRDEVVDRSRRQRS
jgi:enoyl-CoA hydratase